MAMRAVHICKGQAGSRTSFVYQGEEPMRRLVVLLGLLGVFMIPSTAQASFPDPWGDLQVSGTSIGTNCHLNRCQGNGSFGVTLVANTANFWSVAKCGVAIGAFIAGNGFLIAKARKAGGIFKVAKRLWKAK